MRVDYSVLSETASRLSGAAAHVSGEPMGPTELGSGAANTDAAHAAVVAARSAILSELAALLRAQSRACTEMVALFRALDAQIAAQITMHP